MTTPTRDTLPVLYVAPGQAARLKALAAAAGYESWSAFVRAAIAAKLDIDQSEIDPAQWGGRRPYGPAAGQAPINENESEKQ